MKTVILCGGRGTRLGEHGHSVPKALIPIGGKPIIWHLLSIYAFYGFNDFILCLGYLGDQIKEYFENQDTDWKVTSVDTGVSTQTGGRLKSVESLLYGESTFCVTYGDGLADVDISKLVKFHRDHGKVATVTAVHPHSNFGLMDVDSRGSITAFREKPRLNEWVNGGFFVFDREVFDHVGDNDILERAPFERMSKAGEMMAFRHEGFWKCMDTFKDNQEFEALWSVDAPWKVW